MNLKGRPITRTGSLAEYRREWMRRRRLDPAYKQRERLSQRNYDGKRGGHYRDELLCISVSQQYLAIVRKVLA